MAKLTAALVMRRSALGRSTASGGTGGGFRCSPATMESYFKELTLWLASGSEAAAALVIGLATIEATLRALWLFVKGAFPHVGVREHQDDKEKVRLRLGPCLPPARSIQTCPRTGAHR